MTVLVAFGTRPEAIKLAPVIIELRRRSRMRVLVVTTGQHRELVSQVLNVFAIVPDADLGVMQPRQALAALSSRVLASMDQRLAEMKPDLVVVQGDTTSAFMCALAAFYRRIPVGHVEAGLRTLSALDPFPEEMNRRLTSRLSSWHFAPTDRARECLIAEGVSPDALFMTGNTVVDALCQIRETDAFKAVQLPVKTGRGERLLLVTLHRREHWGAPLLGMCKALRAIVEQCGDVRIVIPVHLNPAVREVVYAELGNVSRISLIEPLEYLPFIALMEASWLVLTDSGGVQEEAPALGCPVLVLRNTTERPEAVESGVARLVGTDPDAILRAALDLLQHPDRRAEMARRVSPFGDGHAARRIADVLEAQAC
jgi:UDP-N-acetylglucosamine 2-epimerase (non-hydrolysing)